MRKSLKSDSSLKYDAQQIQITNNVVALASFDSRLPNMR